MTENLLNEARRQYGTRFKLCCCSVFLRLVISVIIQTTLIIQMFLLCLNLIFKLYLYIVGSQLYKHVRTWVVRIREMLAPQKILYTRLFEGCVP